MVAAPISVTDPAWTGEGEQVQSFAVGDHAFMLNPYFADGTLLRGGPSREANFLPNGEHVRNDAEVDILELEGTFAKVQAFGADTASAGWCRVRNLSHSRADGSTGAAPAAKARARRPLDGATVTNLHAGADEETREKQSSESFKRLMEPRRRGDQEAHIVRQSLKKQASAFRSQIHRRRAVTLDPHSRLVQRWDVVTALALLFTATVTPVEVCILEPTTLAEMPGSALAWVNRLVDVIFLCDIVVTCFVAYQEGNERGGMWVHEVHKIVRRYASSWLVLDVLTTIPIDVIIAA